MASGVRSDVLVIGGGPAGSIAALCAARRGLRVTLLDKQSHPRFHIGESMLPMGCDLLDDLGVGDRVRALPHVPKYGAAFVMSDADSPTSFRFRQRHDRAPAFNIERASFDLALLDAARDAGCDVRQSVAARRLVRLATDDVEVESDEGSFNARCLIDASGQQTVVGRHLGTRSAIPSMSRVSYFGHFEQVERAPGPDGGSPVIVMSDEGWFWLIPLDDTRTSVGMVLDAEVARSTGVPATSLLRWGVDRSPFMCRAMREAIGPDRNEVCADFSYRSRPYAGDGYLLAGDAAVFVDPVFSSGVSLAIAGAIEAAGAAAEILDHPARADAARARYIASVERTTSPLFRMVEHFYDHSFRELLMNERGPLGVHDAVLQVLAGRVIPRVGPLVRVQLALFEFLLDVHRRTGRLVPRLETSSLLAPVSTRAAS